MCECRYIGQHKRIRTRIYTDIYICKGTRIEDADETHSHANAGAQRTYVAGAPVGQGGLYLGREGGVARSRWADLHVILYTASHCNTLHHTASHCKTL